MPDIDSDLYRDQPDAPGRQPYPPETVPGHPSEIKELHPSVAAILRYFEHDHLPPNLAAVSARFRDLAFNMAVVLDGPEVTAGLRKLLEAKDCFVRAALDA